MEYINKYVWFQEGPGIRKKQYTENGVKLLNVANLINGKIDLSTSKRYISKNEAYGKYKHFLVDEGDFIIASSGIQVNYFDKKMGLITKDQLPLCMNTSTIRFKTLDKNKLDIRYFMYFMKSEQFKLQLKKLITGSAQLNFGPSHLKKVKISVPELKIQKEYISKLDNITKIIDIKNKQIMQLNQLIKSLFVEMFGDPILNNKKLPIKKLKDLTITILSGTTPKGGKKVYIDSGIEFYRSQNIWKNKIKKDDIAYIDQKTHENMKKSSLKYNDLLITKTGRINTENSSLGRTAIYRGENYKANINGHVYLVRLKENENPEFILRILISNQYLEYIRSVCVGGIDKRQLNKNHIENFPIIYPSKEKQKIFTNKVNQIDKQKFEIQKKKQVTY